MTYQEAVDLAYAGQIQIDTLQANYYRARHESDFYDISKEIEAIGALVPGAKSAISANSEASENEKNLNLGKLTGVEAHATSVIEHANKRLREGVVHFQREQAIRKAFSDKTERGRLDRELRKSAGSAHRSRMFQLQREAKFNYPVFIGGLVVLGGILGSYIFLTRR